VRPIFLIIIVVSLSSFSKSLVITDNNVCKKNKDEFSLVKALQAIKNDEFIDSAELACLHHQVAIKHYISYDYLLSLKYNKEALKIREQINDGFLWKTHHNIALVYDELDDYKEAIQHNQLAYNLPGIKAQKDSISILRFLSMEYSEIGDFEQALKYGNIAIKIKASKIKMAQAYHSLGTISAETKDSINSKQALQYFNKALQLIKNHEHFDQMCIPYYINKGAVYVHLNEKEKALENYNKALDLLASGDNLYKSSILNNMGNVLIKQKEYDLALEKLDEALYLKRTHFKNDIYHVKYAINYINIGDCYSEMKDYKKALQYFQGTIINLTNSFRDEDIFQNPQVIDSLYVYSNVDLIRVLDLKAQAALKLYYINKDKAYLKLAYQTYLNLLGFHNKLQTEIATENSRLYQAKNVLPYVENALDVVYELQDKEPGIFESAFRLIEKNKSTVLLQSMNEAQALQFANIPNTIIEQESELKTSVNFYKKQLNDAKVNEEIESIDSLAKLSFEEENKYNQLIQDLERNYPNYYRLKYQQNETRLKDVEDYLKDSEALLEYFVGERSIYVLSIQKEKSKLYKVTKPENWDELINNFRKSVTDSNQLFGKDTYVLFANNAFELYKTILNEVLNDLKPSVDYLKIIPDAELNYIPFDVLLTKPANTDKVNYANLDYLIKNKTVSYAYSAALLLETSQAHKTDSLQLYAGFAPVYEQGNFISNEIYKNNRTIVLRNGNMIDLPHARKGVQQIAKNINGEAFIAKEATKQKFIDIAHRFNILHLAMHGSLNDENPLYSNLTFTATADSADNSLFASDLYNIELNAGLVVLSACNTGAGELQKGEGVMSLSRAFTYAGAKSLLMSLWEVPDKSTAIIMQNFFTQLKKGDSNDKSLQTAKLDFIKNYPEQAHPIHWAGFVPSGNMISINFKNKQFNWWLWILAVFMLGGVGALIYKNK